MDCVIDLKLVATPLHARLTAVRDVEPIVVQLTSNREDRDRPNRAFLVDSDDDELPPGFSAYFVRRPRRGESAKNGDCVYTLPRELAYLDDGDIVRVNPRGAELWVMYRRSSSSNSLLLTERCNSWCVMCSQPPRERDEDALVRAWLDAIPLMSPETRELGFTGGEPTLLGDTFLDLVAACRDQLPCTALHVLSNGRVFNYLSFAQQLAAVRHPDLVIGIPIYSDLAWQHDFIVQAPRAFDQTIRGILNLARCGVRIELRVVIHRYSVERLVSLATFITRNLPFVEHVALMGLEPVGFAKSNLGALWVDPIDYQRPLEDAIGTLSAHGMNISIYNHQLCVLPRCLWSLARQSISDWKNVYLPVCGECTARKQCAGFFHSSMRLHSRAIQPIVPDWASL